MRRIIILVLLVFALASVQITARATITDFQTLLTESLGSFQQRGPAQAGEDFSLLAGRLDGAVAAKYANGRGETFSVYLAQYHQDSDAYSRLTLEAQLNSNPNASAEIQAAVGTASVVRPDELLFVKGRFFAAISSSKNSNDARMELARALAERIDKGDGDIPVLIKHLPQWEQAQKTAVFLNRFNTLEPLIGNQPVTSAVTSEGDADAVVAKYGTARLLVIEFNTPQLAAENDQRIITKIRELWQQGEPAPTAYRRVGNYVTFVFDASDEHTANQLIDQIRYEQVVQWLGDNPYWLKEAQRRYTETTLGVFVAVLKASGFAAIVCFALGGLFGAVLFTRRRKQQQTVEAFSDAGGMLRLNLDEMTPQTDPSRLVR